MIIYDDPALLKIPDFGVCFYRGILMMHWHMLGDPSDSISVPGQV